MTLDEMVLKNQPVKRRDCRVVIHTGNSLVSVTVFLRDLFYLNLGPASLV